MGAPARGYRWADFTTGNLVGVRHGADSPRLVSPIAEALAERLPHIAPWTSGDAFAGARQAWAWSEGQAVLLRAYVDEHGPLTPDGEERPAARRLDRVEARAAALRSELGLNPAAMLKLLASAAAIDTGAVHDSLAALRAAGRELREAAERRALAAVNGDSS